MSAAAPAYASTQLVPGCPACPSHPASLLLPGVFPSTEMELQRQLESEKGHSHGERHSEEGESGAVSGLVRSDPGERLREAQGRGMEVESGTCTFDLWFAWLLRHSWGSPYVLQVDQCFYHQS